MFAIAFLIGVASAPQERVGRPMPHIGRMAGNPMPLRKYTDADAHKAHQLFGECVIKRWPKQAEAYILHPEIDAKERTGLLRKMDLGECLIDIVNVGYADLQMTFPGDTLRYSLAEPLVRRDYGQAPIADFKAVPALKHRAYNEAEVATWAKEMKPDELEKAKLSTRGAIFLSGFGECVVRTDPLNSFALIMGQPGSAEDKAAMTALSGTLASCLPTGHTLSFDRMQVRGTIANNYFRLANALDAARANSRSAQ